MKVVKLITDVEIEGVEYAQGDSIATIDGPVEFGSIISLLRSRRVEIVDPEEVEDEEVEDEEVEDEEVEENDPIVGQELIDAGLSQVIVDRLAASGLDSIESVKAYVAEGNKLVDLDGVGKGFAKMIEEALDI